MGIEPFDCSATQMLNGSSILGVVVGDSLTAHLCGNVIFFWALDRKDVNS